MGGWVCHKKKSQSFIVKEHDSGSLLGFMH